MKNRHHATLLASTLLSFFLLAPHMATAGQARQGARDNSTLNIGITFVNPGWYSAGHRTVDRRIHYVRDRHGHPVLSPRVRIHEKQLKHGGHFRKPHWQKKQHHHHRSHRNHRPHSYYR